MSSPAFADETPRSTVAMTGGGAANDSANDLVAVDVSGRSTPAAPQPSSQYVVPSRELRKEADPRPLALAGFSSVILVVAMHNAGWVESTSWLGPLSLLAGIALLFGGVYEFVLGATLPATTYGIYGALWLSTGIFVLSSPGANIKEALTFLRIPMAVFTLYALVASLFVSRASFVIFATLECMLICYIAGYLGEVAVLTKIGGYFGFVCASAGFYTSASLLLEPFIDIPTGRPLLRPRTHHRMV